MSSTSDEHQPGRASRITAGAIVLLIFLTPVIGFLWLRTMSRTTAESHLLSHTRDMIIRHYMRTRGEWPRSWDNLRADFEPADANYETPSLETLQKTVAVDFNLDLATVTAEANSDKPFRVVWLKGRPDTEAVIDGNAWLHKFLEKQIARR